MIYVICHKNNGVYGPKGSAMLTEKEMMLFLLLIKNRTDINDIIGHIWQDRAAVINQNTLSQLAFRLRNKLRKAAIPFIFTLSISRGVRIKRECLCAFISIKHNAISGLLIRMIRVLRFFKSKNNSAPQS